ncbi:MAG: hypothetical protein M3Z00_01360 [Actinomycetota bacterium]|nr:hypothetical protein [Actinomycetota bacterium]
MNEITAIPLAGIPDLQRAALAEARRIMRVAKGDRAAATILVYDELERRGLINQVERKALAGMHDIGMQRSASKSRSKSSKNDGPEDATGSYLQVSRMYDGMLTKGDTGPVALALAAGHVGSYEVVENPSGTGVVYAKNTRSYQSILGGAGAIIGSGFGPMGGAIGGAVGTVVGTIVDDCKD